MVDLPSLSVLFLVITIIYLINKRDNSNKYHLNYLILFFAALLVDAVLLAYSHYASSKINFYWFYIFRILHYIFFYKYIAAFLLKKRNKNIYLYIPLLVFSMVYIYGLNGYYLFIPGKLKYEDYSTFYSFNSNSLFGENDLFLAGTLVSTYFLFIIYFLYQKVLFKLDTSKKRLKYLKQWIVLLFSYLTITLIAANINNIALIFNLDFKILIIVNNLIIVVSTLTILFFTRYLKLVTEVKNEEGKSITIEDENMYLYILKSLNKTKMYINPAKNLSHLATTTKISSKVITELIYKFESISFHNFLNKHRIEYAKQKIKEGYLSLNSIEALYLESGFKSAQPFYIAFKKFEGKTPTEYLNSLK